MSDFKLGIILGVAAALCGFDLLCNLALFLRWYLR